MNSAAYLQAREFTSQLGQPLLLIILLLAAALIVFESAPALRRHSRYLVLLLTLALAAGWALLAHFHYQISRTVLLVDPTGQLPSGRFYIPVWIENEKFYFWTLVLSLLVFFAGRRERVWRTATNITLGGFAVLTYFTSNPFAQPLPDFHNALGRYLTAFSTGNGANAVQAYHALHGKMVGYYNSSYMWIHPPLLFIAYSTFVIAFLAAVFMLVKKEHDYERLSYAYVKPGYILLTVGMLIGYPWAVQAWQGEPWWYDPKINVTLMMWLLYSAYLHSRLYLHRRGMWSTTAVLGYLAFLGVIVTYVTTYVIPGIHSTAG